MLRRAPSGRGWQHTPASPVSGAVVSLWLYMRTIHGRSMATHATAAASDGNLVLLIAALGSRRMVMVLMRPVASVCTCTWAPMGSLRTAFTTSSESTIKCYLLLPAHIHIQFAMPRNAIMIQERALLQASTSGRTAVSAVKHRQHARCLCPPRRCISITCAQVTTTSPSQDRTARKTQRGRRWAVVQSQGHGGAEKPHARSAAGQPI